MKIKKLRIYVSISLKDTSKGYSYRNCVGFVYIFVKKLTLSGINILDMISTNSQFTFIIEKKYFIDSLKIIEDVKENFKI